MKIKPIKTSVYFAWSFCAMVTQGLVSCLIGLASRNISASSFQAFINPFQENNVVTLAFYILTVVVWTSFIIFTGITFTNSWNKRPVFSAICSLASTCFLFLTSFCSIILIMVIQRDLMFTYESILNSLSFIVNNIFGVVAVGIALFSVLMMFGTALNVAQMYTDFRYRGLVGALVGVACIVVTIIAENVLYILMRNISIFSVREIYVIAISVIVIAALVVVNIAVAKKRNVLAINEAWNTMAAQAVPQQNAP